MLTSNIVDIALFITFDNRVVRSTMDLEKFRQDCATLLTDSGVIHDKLRVERFTDLEPDTQKSLILVQYSGTTLRPFNELRFKQFVVDQLHHLREVSGSERGISPEDIQLRLMFRKPLG